MNEHERASKIKKRPRGKARDEESLPQVITEEAIQEKAAVFSANLAAFGREQRRRESERNPELQVPATLTSVEIEFHDWFDAFTYERRYYGTFGLRLNKYAEYNTRGLEVV
ncbi:hypothetical protein [Hymenobacter sp. DG01]|uniref:hypothetical protein n=1 Tax=Hymenobacter sp. DG01 TaxID=2584940 RepID=UPI00111EC380|nr:hypothetical protein [Hymenobacter sp. DG01]